MEYPPATSQIRIHPKLRLRPNQSPRSDGVRDERDERAAEVPDLRSDGLDRGPAGPNLRGPGDPVRVRGGAAGEPGAAGGGRGEGEAHTRVQRRRGDGPAQRGLVRDTQGGDDPGQRGGDADTGRRVQGEGPGAHQLCDRVYF